jgi:hypothetical protein
MAEKVMHFFEIKKNCNFAALNILRKKNENYKFYFSRTPEV